MSSSFYEDLPNAKSVELIGWSKARGLMTQPGTDARRKMRIYEKLAHVVLIAQADDMRKFSSEEIFDKAKEIYCNELESDKQIWGDFLQGLISVAQNDLVNQNSAKNPLDLVEDVINNLTNTEPGIINKIEHEGCIATFNSLTTAAVDFLMSQQMTLPQFATASTAAIEPELLHQFAATVTQSKSLRFLNVADMAITAGLNLATHKLRH